jgi:hypothetical protein
MNDDINFIEALENASDYLPEYGEVYNESGLVDIYVGHLFGIGQHSESSTSSRPVFLTKKEA